MAGELDPYDLLIIEALLADGRTPVAQIAGKIGLSRPAVAERIDKLQSAGTLRGTTAVLDPAAMGLAVTAFVSARNPNAVDSRMARAFRSFLEKPEVLEAHTVAGDDCYLLKVRTGSIESLNSLIASLTAPPLSLNTRTTIVLETHIEKVGGVRLPAKGKR